MCSVVVYVFVELSKSVSQLMSGSGAKLDRLIILLSRLVLYEANLILQQRLNQAKDLQACQLAENYQPRLQLEAI